MLVADPDFLVLLQTLSWKKRIKQLDGMYSERCCKKLFSLTGNSCTMGARKDAENNASVTQLHSVYVMASVLKINIMSKQMNKVCCKLVLFLRYASLIV